MTLQTERHVQRASRSSDRFCPSEQPHKIYEWPWLRDQKFQYEARVLGYGPPETWDRERDGHQAHNAYMGWNQGYKRSAFDEVCFSPRSACPPPAMLVLRFSACLPLHPQPEEMHNACLAICRRERKKIDNEGSQYGDRAFDVDMRPAQGCYDDDSWDCYREQFDADTGYLLPSATDDDE